MMLLFATHPNAQQTRKRRTLPDARDRLCGDYSRPWRPGPSFTRCRDLQIGVQAHHSPDAVICK